MARMHIARKLYRTWRRLVADRSGNIAMMFGLSLIPVIGLSGAAVDYSRGNSARTAMQAALDATALMLSKEVQTLPTDQLSTTADTYFRSIFKHPDATIDSVTADYSVGSKGPTLKVTVAGHVNTLLMPVLPGHNLKRMDIGSSAVVSWGNNRLRVALALDNTGSMASSNKMVSLKTATKNLLGQLQAAATNSEDVYVSIVPFAVHVNAGADNYTRDWIDWTQWEAPPPNSMPGDNVGPGSSCPYPSDGSLGFRCTASPVNNPNCIAGTGATDGCVSRIPSSGQYAGYICPSMENGRNGASRALRYYNGCYNSVPAWSCTGSSCSCGGRSNCSCSGSDSSRVCTQTPYTHTWIPNARSTWNGCTMDRGAAAPPGTSPGNDQKINPPVPGDSATLFPADQYALPCPQPMRGLAKDWAAMNSFVDNMVPNGATNQPIGLVWAWQSLTGGGPLAAKPKDPDYQYDDIIILLSDGLNTQDRWYGNGSSTSNQVDGRMAGAAGTCQNIKNAKITIYTVQVSTEGDPLSTLLQNCATDANKFFFLTSSNQIVSTFQQIGTEIAKLRLTN